MTISIKGKDVEVDSVRVGEVDVVLTGSLPKQAWINHEWHSDVNDPSSVIETLKKISPRPDLFTFVQRVPHTEPRFPYYWEAERWAVLPVTTFDHWWSNQIKSLARNRAKQAGKKGVVMKRPDFDDAFIQGMVEIFNETPIRQGRPFWHYGKDFETVKKEFSRYLYRESLIGAYFEDELIGFIMLSLAGDFAVPAQIISKNSHRNKSTNNALLAEAVRVCAEKEIPYFVYFTWDEGSLGTFKKVNGFEPWVVPRYYVPLTLKGKVALKLNLHRGWRGLVPEKMQEPLKGFRNRFHSKRISGG